MKTFEGRWQLYESQNYEEFLKAMGVSAPIREALRTVLPLIEVSVERDQRISFVTITPIKKVEVTFTLNEEYEERLLDGTILRGKAEKNGGKLVSTSSSCDGTLQMRVTREILGGDLVLTLEALTKGVKATRKYKRI